MGRRAVLASVRGHNVTGCHKLAQAVLTCFFLLHCIILKEIIRIGYLVDDFSLVNFNQ